MPRSPIADPATLEVSHQRSREVAASWRHHPACRWLAAHFDAVDPGDGDAVATVAARLLADHDWVGDLLEPLIAELRTDPWFEPPFRVNRDALRIGAVLFDHPAVSITATVLSGDVLASLPKPATVVVPGRLSVVRYVRAGGVRLRLWRAPAIPADRADVAAARCMPVSSIALADGAVHRIDGRTDAQLITAPKSDIVTLTATIRAGAAPYMREFAAATGELVRLSALDDGSSRSQMLLALLRHAGRADAADCFEMATHDACFSARWDAMREWLALDAPRAAPRLAEMSRHDPHADIRLAATATLAQVEAAIAARTDSRCLV